VDLRANASHTTGGANNFVAQTIKYDPANKCQLDPVAPFGGPKPDPNRVTDVFCSSYIGHNDRTVNDVSLKADKDLPIGTFTGILAYNRVKEFESGTQFPYTATRNLFGFLNGTQTQYTDDSGRSLELRLTSPSKQRLRWMGGLYFLRSTGFISTTTGTDSGTGIVELTHDPRFGAVDNPTLSWLADTKHDSTRSVFGNIAYDVLPNLEASVGFRYDHNTRTQDVDPRQVSAPSTPAVPPGCTPSTTDLCVNRANFSAMQPTASLRYKINEEVQVYATAGRGFRAGQFNQSGAAAAAVAAGVVGVKDMVDSEYTTSFEAGVKMEFDNRTRIEGAVFRSVVKGQQYFLFIPSISAQVLANIDKVTLTGGELEVAHTPMKGLDLYAGLGVTRSRIDAYQLNPAAVGNWAPYVPQISLNLGAQYRFPIMANLNGMTRVDFIEKGKQYWDPENSAPRSSIGLVNLRFGIEDAHRKWSLLASIVNATNRQYNEEFVAGGFATVAAPRVYRLDLRYNL
jgi:iron complex outermembrane receptor protein